MEIVLAALILILASLSGYLIGYWGFRIIYSVLCKIFNWEDWLK